MTVPSWDSFLLRSHPPPPPQKNPLKSRQIVGSFPGTAKAGGVPDHFSNTPPYASLQYEHLFSWPVARRSTAELTPLLELEETNAHPQGTSPHDQSPFITQGGLKRCQIEKPHRIKTTLATPTQGILERYVGKFYFGIPRDAKAQMITILPLPFLFRSPSYCAGSWDSTRLPGWVGGHLIKAVIASPGESPI